MNECKRIREAHGYHDGELSPEEATRFEAHLRNCAACRAELEAVGALSMLLDDAVGAELPQDVADRLHTLAGNASVAPLAKKLTALAAGILIACLVWSWNIAAPGDAENGLRWELAAVGAPEAYEEDEAQLTARWILSDLSRENAHD